ncbi:MAG: hypothetical protein IJK89_00615 [Clostridia bacterium]|nr:hypothetical protein [Clostridia bacterium]
MKNLLVFAVSAAAFALAVRYAAQAKEGLAAALSTCATVLVPSLFPMLVLSRFAAACPCPAALKKLLAGPLRALFGLSPDCAAPLLLGLTGGYPLAAKSADAAKEAGLITQEDVRRLTLFFTCPGLPFAVVAAGSGFFHSRPVGYTLFASCALADLAVAALYHRFAPKPPRPAVLQRQQNAPPVADRLVAAVEGAVQAMLSICAWIGAFYALLRVVGALTGNALDVFLTPVAEVTSALEEAAARKNLPLTAACLAFGGLCVWCQLLPEIRKNGVGSARYLAVRTLCAGLACGMETALLRLLAVPVPTETRIGGVYISANSAAGAAGLLLLCAVFMAETARRQEA